MNRVAARTRAVLDFPPSNINDAIFSHHPVIRSARASEAVLAPRKICENPCHTISPDNVIQWYSKFSSNTLFGQLFVGVGTVNGSDTGLGSHGRYQRLDAEQRRRLAAKLYLLISTAPDDAYMAVANMLPLGEKAPPL